MLGTLTFCRVWTRDTGTLDFFFLHIGLLECYFIIYFNLFDIRPDVNGWSVIFSVRAYAKGDTTFQPAVELSAVNT